MPAASHLTASTHSLRSLGNDDTLLPDRSLREELNIWGRMRTYGYVVLGRGFGPGFVLLCWRFCFFFHLVVGGRMKKKTAPHLSPFTFPCVRSPFAF